MVIPVLQLLNVRIGSIGRPPVSGARDHSFRRASIASAISA
jgi:hypothetical protein